MQTDELEDTDEMFPIAFRNNEKDTIKIGLMFHCYVMMEDGTKDKKLKDTILIISNMINKLLEAAEDKEEIPLPYELLVILYKSLMLSANGLHTPAIHKIVAALMQADKMKHAPSDVKALLHHSKGIAQHYINFINDTYGEVPLVKDLIKGSEENWRDINENRPE